MNIFSDQEIHDRCLAECRLDYLECRANCDSTLCDSGCLAEFQGDFRVVKDFNLFLRMREYLSVWTGLSRWLPRLHGTPALPRRMRRRAAQQSRLPSLFERRCKWTGEVTKFIKKIERFSGNLPENVSGWYWMSQFLLRGLYRTATFVSLHWKRG